MLELTEERLLEDEDIDEVTDDEERIDDDEEERMEDTTLDDRLDIDDADEPPLPQIAPVTTGVSTAPLVLTCTPKDATCPGCKLPFQLRLDAL